MNVYKDIKSFIPVKKTVVTTGTFDGLHNGHREIISRVRQLAKDIDGESVVLTFYPHPQLVLHPGEKNIFILNSQEEKIRLFEELGIDDLIFIPFTLEFAATSSDAFIKNILVDKLQAKKLVIGYDHHFGKNREGDLQNLLDSGKKYNFDVEDISAHTVGDITVSSTKIRKALLAGDIVTANNLLGYKYFLSGRVIKGDGIGRTLGYPTANIEVDDPNKLIPAQGVYVVDVEFGAEHFGGMLNYGTRPTLDGIKQVIEANIFDFDRNIYYEPICVHFIERLRNEVKFPDLDKLKEQLLMDKENALKILSEK